MILLDSNILIYSAQPNYVYLRPLVYGYEIYTRNTADFNWVAGLKVTNPIP